MTSVRSSSVSVVWRPTELRRFIATTSPAEQQVALDRFEVSAPLRAITRAAANAPPPQYRHVVREGDSLATLGGRFGTYPQVIAADNALSDDAALVPGQPIAIPGWQAYTVKAGDTLASI